MANPPTVAPPSSSPALSRISAADIATIAPGSAADRAVGALVGLAVGDALGTTREFERRDARRLHTEVAGGGPFELQPGQWTDDTAMALALAASLLDCGSLDERDLIARFLDWYRDGAYSCTGTCFDIGTVTRDALARFERTGEPIAGSTDPFTAGNGSIMRLAPAVLSGGDDAERAADFAQRQGRTTHGTTQAVEAYGLLAMLLHDAIATGDRDAVLRPRDWSGDAAIAAIARGDWQAKGRNAIRSGGYVVDTLEAALWCVGQTDNFEAALVLAVNLADDADTVGAVTGQLAGALYGRSAIPERWLARLAWREAIERTALALHRLGAADEPTSPGAA